MVRFHTFYCVFINICAIWTGGVEEGYSDYDCGKIFAVNGIILISPCFQYEMDYGIEDVIRSKSTGILTTYLIRPILRIFIYECYLYLLHYQKLQTPKWKRRALIKPDKISGCS